jgi:hypothetical protein
MGRGCHGFRIGRVASAIRSLSGIRVDGQPLKRVRFFIHKARKGKHAAHYIHQGHEESWDADE